METPFGSKMFDASPARFLFAACMGSADLRDDIEVAFSIPYLDVV